MTSLDEYIDQYPELSELAARAQTSDFLWSVYQALSAGRGTPRQAEAAAKSLRSIGRYDAAKAERKAADDALAASGVRIPTGRVTFSGEIVSATLKDTDFGTSLKITVRSDDGWTAWGSAPSPITVPYVGDDGGGLDGLKGARVTITATLSEPSEGATGVFGFFKRPKLVAFDGLPTALADGGRGNGKYPA